MNNQPDHRTPHHDRRITANIQQSLDMVDRYYEATKRYHDAVRCAHIAVNNLMAHQRSVAANSQLNQAMKQQPSDEHRDVPDAMKRRNESAKSEYQAMNRVLELYGVAAHNIILYSMAPNFTPMPDPAAKQARATALLNEKPRPAATWLRRITGYSLLGGAIMGATTDHQWMSMILAGLFLYWIKTHYQLRERQ